MDVFDIFFCCFVFFLFFVVLEIKYTLRSLFWMAMMNHKVFGDRSPCVSLDCCVENKKMQQRLCHFLSCGS